MKFPHCNAEIGEGKFFCLKCGKISQMESIPVGQSRNSIPLHRQETKIKQIGINQKKL